jgi:hypothetical protein
MALSATLSLAPLRLTVKPRNLRLAGRSTALFSGFTVSRSEFTDEATYACHDPLSCALAFDHDVAVVRITRKAMAAPVQFPVQFIQYDVG